MKINGFKTQGKWYKGNLHCHSTDSDGSLSPQEVAELYRKHGYSFLAISDHDIYTDYRNELDREDFKILPAIEASAVLYKDDTKGDRIAVHHIHGILGTKEMQESAPKGVYAHKEKHDIPTFFADWDGAKVAQNLQDELKAHGCITIYNHPVWSRVKEGDFINLEGITALEIYNYGTVNESGTGKDVLHWDVMLGNGRNIFATASDDNHNDGIVYDTFGGFIWVKAERLDHESIVQAIIDGNYYSSNGPEIYDWGIENDIAFVECSAVNRVNFMAGNYINAGSTVMCKTKEETMTRAEFKLKGNEKYIRVECIDKYGNTAWSNPIFMNK